MDNGALAFRRRIPNPPPQEKGIKRLFNYIGGKIPSFKKEVVIGEANSPETNLEVNSVETWKIIYGNNLEVLSTDFPVTLINVIDVDTPVTNPQATFFAAAISLPDYVKKNSSLEEMPSIFPTNSIQLLPPPPVSVTTVPLIEFNNGETTRTGDELMQVLLGIDVNKLVTGRVSVQSKNGYTLNELKAIARRIGLPASIGRKDVLIANIRRLLERYNIATS